MPGVHVRGIGKSDRSGTLQAQPTLNVPGSYWLSHKQNIYKFTFKYHEPIRDTKEFLYKDELMKVIRRIIKCQPSQGQLSTMHLAITYKHTFWTRQDKMFAMLKFRNRQGAAVFPQAFILTITIVENPEIQLNGMVIKDDPNSDCKRSSPIQPLPISPELSETTALTTDYLRNREDSKNFPTRLLRRLDSSTDRMAPSTMAIDTIARQKSFTSTDFYRPLNVSEQSESTKTRGTGNRTRRRHDTWASSSELNPMGRYDGDLELGDTLTSKILDYSQEAPSKDIVGARPYSKCYEGTQEREIRGAGIISEPITPRSSDITDQVMEGLMFTIRQGENNVKVVEQRTKMELDEVLENSEKVETKEGERSLVNSSLLRLENLVTKIEMPDKQLMDAKFSDTAPVIGNFTSLSHFPGLSYNVLSSSLVREQANIPVNCTSHSPFKSSSRSNWNHPVGDQVLKTPLPSMDGFVPIELGNVSLADRRENIIKEYHKSMTGQKKRKFVSSGISAENTSRLTVLENEKIEDDFNSTSGVGADDDNNNNNNDNNNNNNTSNIASGRVQIDMWKLLQDITRGVKVMVERISDTDIRNATRSSAIPVSASTSTGRRILTRSKK